MPDLAAVPEWLGTDEEAHGPEFPRYLQPLVFQVLTKSWLMIRLHDWQYNWRYSARPALQKAWRRLRRRDGRVNIRPA